MAKKYFITTYGCQMNESDSERIASVLEKIGYRKSSRENGADLIIINMCSVRQSAVDRAYGLLPKFKKLKEKNQKVKTVLTGCVLKTDKRKFKKQFDLILDIKDLMNWPKILTVKSGALINSRQQEKPDYLKIKPKYRTCFRALIPISNGCNNACAYCVVPKTRGVLVCRSHKEILEETKDAVKKGYKEIWLLGQNVNDYQSPVDSSIDFARLLKIINDIPGNFWIRFASPNPKDFSNEIINSIAQCKKVTEYINIPIQSGNNEILKRMNRPYTVEKYKNLIKKIRKKIPGIALSTDIIVGFPGETKRQFQSTARFLKEIKFDMAYIAQYSPRQQTQAIKMKDNISKKEKKRRWKILSKLLEKTALGKNKSYLGKKLTVLADIEKNGFFYGKTRNYKTVKFPAVALAAAGKQNTNLVGQFVKVKITNALPWGLKGELISKI